MKKNWIIVASHDHVKIGKEQGFMQACHGKQKPLDRIKPNDTIVYYSPTQVFGVKKPLQQFTAAGIVKTDKPYQAKMNNNFYPFRRDVDWFSLNPTSIKPLLDILGFIKGVKNWGMKFRYGLFEISSIDYNIILTAMGTNLVNGDSQPILL